MQFERVHARMGVSLEFVDRKSRCLLGLTANASGHVRELRGFNRISTPLLLGYRSIRLAQPWYTLEKAQSDNKT